MTTTTPRVGGIDVTSQEYERVVLSLIEESPTFEVQFGIYGTALPISRALDVLDAHPAVLNFAYDGDTLAVQSNYWDALFPVHHGFFRSHAFVNTVDLFLWLTGL